MIADDDGHCLVLRGQVGASESSKFFRTEQK